MIELEPHVTNPRLKPLAIRETVARTEISRERCGRDKRFRADQFSRISQTKEVPRLIQRESSGVAAAAIKKLIDFSAVMDGGFGGITTGECRRGIGTPACFRD